MVRSAAIVALSLVIAAPAWAQSTTTDCRKFGDGFNCDTKPTTDGTEELSKGIASFSAMLRERRERKAVAQQQQASAAAAATRQAGERAVVEAIQAHDCIRARDTALTVGGIGLAAQVVQVCPIPAQ